MLYRLTALAAVLLLTTGCDVNVGKGGFSIDIAEGKATDEWVRHYNLASGGRLEIVNVNGTIEASAADGRQVEVKAIREAKAGSDEAGKALLDKGQIVEEVQGNQVKVEARGEWGFRGVSFGRSRISVKYEVRVPTGLTVFFKTQNGGVRLDNVQGRITASTTNGGINGRGVRGTLNAATVNGGVQMALSP